MGTRQEHTPTSENRSIRQAIVIVHGMGEQRPLDTLSGFIRAAMPPNDNGKHQYFSRPDKVTDSYESRRYLVRGFRDGNEEIPQTELYEYHWAHLMQGNRLDDLWPTFRRMLLQLPWTVPAGLKAVWLLFWAGIIFTAWALWRGPFSDLALADFSLQTLIGTLLGGGLLGVGLTYVVAHFLPSWITKNFVDVVRYLDTSPRSYEARRNIRKGMVDLLEGLHQSGRYQRIIVVAHSLGAFIAYDGITYLWPRMSKLHDGGGSPTGGGEMPRGLLPLERAAEQLGEPPPRRWFAKRPREELDRFEARLQAFRSAQWNLWLGLRQHGNPWLITDFVTLGAQTYFAHRLYTKNRRTFDERVDRRELPTCPPLPDEGKEEWVTSQRYTWNNHGRRVLYEGAPFAVVRWTNLWFPSGFGFFGDWFGGATAPLYGRGIRDVPLVKNRPWRWVPGYAHTLYFRLRKATYGGSATYELRRAMDLPGSGGLTETLRAPKPDPRTATTTAGSELLPRIRARGRGRSARLWPFGRSSF